MADRQRLLHLMRHPREAGEVVSRRSREALRIAGKAATPPVPCPVCGSVNAKVRVIERKDRNRTYEIRICRDCQHVSNAGNTVDYTRFTSVTKFGLTPRVGTEDRTGREFHMARMGSDILQRPSLEVMVFGGGRSLDYRHIAKLPEVDASVMGDVVDLGIDEDFIDITKGTDRRFDLVVACEVIEHFPDPRSEFPRLFELLKDDGLLICSTNIYDGKNLARHTYLYGRGHVSYYSPRAIREISDQNDMLFDFRVPEIVTGTAGPRKRYVFFTRSTGNLQRIAEYFGNHLYAPSEEVRPRQ